MALRSGRIPRSPAWTALAVALAACGGNVVVDGAPGPGSSGSGAAGTGASTASSSSGSTFPCQDTTADPHNCGACGHDCLGGACVKSVCQPVLLASNGYPNGIAVDGSDVYWTDLISGVMRLPLAGGTPELLAPADSPQAIALDPGHVYWTAKDAVGRVPVGGGAAQLLASTPLKTGPWALATDGADLFWADQVAGTLLRMPVAGGNPTLLAKGLVAPDGVVVDDTTVYWANGTNQQVEGAIFTMPKAGGAQTTLALKQKGPRALALDDAHVYWTDSAPYVPNPTGFVMKAPKGGGPATMLASGQGNPLGIAVNGGDVFWVNSDGGTVLRVSVDGGAPVTVAEAQKYVTAIAADAKAIYWTTQDKGGAVMKLAR